MANMEKSHFSEWLFFIFGMVFVLYWSVIKIQSTMKKYICELYGKKSKEEICTCMGKPVYGWGMRFYKDKECKELASINPYHYIRKDKVMLMGGVYVLVHVVK